MRILLIVAIVALSVLVSCRVVAQPRTCADRSVVTQWLADNHAESVIAAGITARGALMELYSTQSGNTWTITLSSAGPDAIACQVGYGHGWKFIDPPPATSPEQRLDP